MNKISTRTAYGEALAEIGSDPRIFVLDADLQCCTRTEKFGALYPERSRNVGIAEANMVGIAAGMAPAEKSYLSIPLPCSRQAAHVSRSAIRWRLRI